MRDGADDLHVNAEPAMTSQPVHRSLSWRCLTSHRPGGGGGEGHCTLPISASAPGSSPRKLMELLFAHLSESWGQTLRGTIMARQSLQPNICGESAWALSFESKARALCSRSVCMCSPPQIGLCAVDRTLSLSSCGSGWWHDVDKVCWWATAGHGVFGHI